ncbi:MAG: fumarylacetoacetate hydrolase family protein [Chloroflexota bacterium]|nr:fumarylacetoacetate hydrolase family protein [Chloroflexota bacterium]
MRVARVLFQDQPVFAVINPDGAVFAVDGDPYAGGAVAGPPLGTAANLQLLAPCQPSKVLCVGRNYATPVRAKGHAWPEAPVVFLKTPNAVIGPDEDILRPENVGAFEYEGELAVVIGRTARRVHAADAADCIFGYTIGNDMTVRDWQQTDAHWTRAKSSDTLCPLGPWIETDLDPANLLIETRVNGEVQQQGRTDDMIFSIGEIIEFVTRTMTLVPGDVILTGAPGGTQAVGDGDEVAVTIAGIGELRNTVRQLAPATMRQGASA